MTTAGRGAAPADLLLHSGRILTPSGWLAEADLLVRDGRIVAAGAGLAAQAPGIERIALGGRALVPGFIDLHVHGGAGSDVMDCDDDGLRRLLRYHAGGGTTAVLATTATAARAELRAALRCIARVRAEQAGQTPTGAQVLGAHVEGPYLSRARPGCHQKEFLREPNPEDNAPLLEAAGVVRHVTLSPELPGALALIERLTGAGITSSLGHTEATEPIVRAAMEWGLSHATHLYNAMSGAVKVGLTRVPGALEVALVEDGLTVEVIADGYHVAPTLIRLAVKAKGPDRVCVVTDAMRGAGMPDGEYTFGGPGGTPVLVREGVARTPDGAGLASSVTPMDAMVRFLVMEVGLALEDVARMAAATPAAVAGVDGHKGTIAPGKDADLVVLDADLRAAVTIVGGHVVYRRPG